MKSYSHILDADNAFAGEVIKGDVSTGDETTGNASDGDAIMREAIPKGHCCWFSHHTINER
jgi:hypothetical protein